MFFFAFHPVVEYNKHYENLRILLIIKRKLLVTNIFTSFMTLILVTGYYIKKENRFKEGKRVLNSFVFTYLYLD